jgi:acyl-CoA thioesterase-2
MRGVNCDAAIVRDISDMLDLSLNSQCSAASLLAPVGVAPDSFVFPCGQTDERRTFGGLLAAQAVISAGRTSEEGSLNSLHMLFLAPGDPQEETGATVERLRDGRKFAARHLKICQSGKTLVSALASLHRGDEGPRHQIQMPSAPDPETLEDQRTVRSRNAERRGAPLRRRIAEELLDTRAVELPLDLSRGIEGQRLLWFKSRDRLTADPLLHQGILALASDVGLVHVGLRVHHLLGDARVFDSASLDHVIWFHGPAQADEWLLQVQRSSISGNGRALTHSSIFSRAGELVATVTQEILARSLK